jgi:hypothetical protein
MYSGALQLSAQSGKEQIVCYVRGPDVPTEEFYKLALGHLDKIWPKIFCAIARRFQSIDLKNHSDGDAPYCTPA